MPLPSVGGFQITNSELRFLELRQEEKGNLSVARIGSLRLPPGIIESGKIKDRANFIAALKSLRDQIVLKDKRAVNVVLTIPTGDVYAQAFNIPSVSKDNLREAAELNLQIISPLPLEKSYYGWVMVGDASKEHEQIELLGVFVQKEIVDDFSSCLEEADFGIAAVEFSSLSMARLLSFYEIIKKNLPYLLVKITQEGLIFMILRNGNLYFDYFHSWDEFSGEAKGVHIDSINSIIYSESQRLFNFYSSHWGGQIKNIVLITPALMEEILAFLKASYPAFEVYALSSTKDNLHGVRGAALRGLASNPLYGDINLMDPKRMDFFHEEQILFFTRFWRNIAIIVASFILILFGSSSLLLKNQAESAKANADLFANQKGGEELDSLKEKATGFNRLVDSISEFKGSAYSLKPFFNEINSIIGSGIIISRFALKTQEDSGALEGLAKDQFLIIDLKNKLAGINMIKDINLPLSNINPQAGGQVYFSLTFKLQKPIERAQ